MQVHGLRYNGWVINDVLGEKKLSESSKLFSSFQKVCLPLLLVYQKCHACEVGPDKQGLLWEVEDRSFGGRYVYPWKVKREVTRLSSDPPLPNSRACRLLPHVPCLLLVLLRRQTHTDPLAMTSRAGAFTPRFLRSHQREAPYLRHDSHCGGALLALQPQPSTS